MPLQSARPTDPERVKFLPADMQDVEARLWQDPFAAVEKHETRPQGSEKHTAKTLRDYIREHSVTVVAVSVFGGSFDEAAESRRRSRFAVVSALGSHGYSPTNSDAVGYFSIPLGEPDVVNLTVPFEWFERSNMSSHVLVLWLNEDKLSTGPLNKLRALFAALTPEGRKGGLNVKLVGPAGSKMLVELVRNSLLVYKTHAVLKNGGTLQVFAPGATIPSCDLYTMAAPKGKQPVPERDDSSRTFEASRLLSDCDLKSLKLLDSLNIVRTIGTDNVLAAALLWELWQRRA